MRLSLRIIFIILVILKVNSGYSAANSITDIIANNQVENNNYTYKSILEKSTEEQNVAKYFKLIDLFANPKANEIVLIRGKLVQILNDNNLFVFQDGNTVANITISPNLWAAINEKAYILDKNIQILAKVIINNTNNSVSFQSIKIFNKNSDTDNYILTQNDKDIAEKLSLNDDTKLTTITIADTAASATTKNSEENFDSVEETQNKKTNNLYGVTTAKEKNPVSTEQDTKTIENTNTSSISEKKITSEDFPDDKPAEQKESDVSKQSEAEPTKEAEETIIKEEKPEPEITNKVPEEDYLNYKKTLSEEKNVVTPEEIQKLEAYDKTNPAQKEKKSFFSWRK